MTARKYIVAVLAVVLLIWGPIDRSWPVWLLIRSGYLVGIPLGTWFILALIWRYWKPDSTTEDRLTRALFAATAGALLMGAVFLSKRESHVGNTEWVETRDEIIPIGDDITLPGPPPGSVFMVLLFSGFFFFLSVAEMREPRRSGLHG